MLNIKTKIVGSKLTIEVDLDKENGLSKSEKSIVIASTQGNQKLDGKYSNVSFGLNIYKPV